MTTPVPPDRRLWQPAEDDLDPQVPQFILDTWNRAGSPRVIGSERYKPEGQALIWFATEWFRSNPPRRFVLPPSLLGWLNAVVLDVGAEVTFRPGVPDPLPSTGRKPLSRLMSCIAKHYSHGDLSSWKNYYEFLSWFAFCAVPAWNMPGLLLPGWAVDILNEPLAGDRIPLTVGMWLYLCLGYPDLVEGTRTGELPALARSFHVLEDILHKGDVRLIPPSVSGFWTKRRTRENLITSFEKVMYLTRRGLSAVGEVPDHEVRRWFQQEMPVTPQTDLFHLFSGSIPGDLAPNEPHGGSIHEKAILIYRDHNLVAGLTVAAARARDALLRSGIPTYDLHYSLPRRDKTEEALHNSTILVSARRKLHIFNLNPDYLPECYYFNLVRMAPQDYVVGQFYWELSRTSTIHNAGMRLVDEIWTASSYLKNLYEREIDRPVFVMGQAIVVEQSERPLERSLFELSESTYVFLSSFDAQSIVERKNPLGLIKAFQSAFPRGTEDVALIIKTRNLNELGTERDRIHWAQANSLIESDPRIRVIEKTMSRDDLNGLYRLCDCFVSLHRSEGFGFGPAEAMGRGKPVITTNYSGVCDFCTAENARLVPFKLIRVKHGEFPYMDPDRIYHWADPDLAVAAGYMRELAEDRACGERLGLAGRKKIESDYSMEALHSRYLRRLRELGFA